MTSSTDLFDGDMFATPGEATHFIGNVLESSTEYSLIATDGAGLPETIAATAARDGKWEGTLEGVRKDGSRFTARAVVTPRHCAERAHVGFLLVSSDITEEMR